MNYKRIYSEIIKNRIKNPILENEYGQRHHILPRSLFPDKEKNKSNLIRLTYREHYICHWLLYKYYKSIGNLEAEQKMWYAFWIMNCCQNDLYMNSHAFEKMKLQSKERNKNLHIGKHLSEEHKEKIRKSIKGRISPNKGKKLSEETKKKMSLSRKGKKRPIEVVMKIANKNRGKKRTEQQKKNIGNSGKGRIPWNKGKVFK